MIKAVVTGGSGFIGSNLVNFLIKKKFFIINIDKLTYSSNKLEDNLKNQKNYKFYKADICNKNKSLKFLKNISLKLFLILLQKPMLIDQLIVQKNLLILI